MIRFMHSVNPDLRVRCFHSIFFTILFCECLYVVIISLVFFLCSLHATLGTHYIGNRKSVLQSCIIKNWGMINNYYPGRSYCLFRCSQHCGYLCWGFCPFFWKRDWMLNKFPVGSKQVNRTWWLGEWDDSCNSNIKKIAVVPLGVVLSVAKCYSCIFRVVFGNRHYSYKKRDFQNLCNLFK